MTIFIQVSAYRSNISNLTGLEYALNLKYLDLGGNNISDISPVVRLPSLTSLILGDNITDISAVAGLTNLTMLSLSGNFSSISPVAGLTNLTELVLNGTSNISDISPLAGLTNLTWLVLRGTNNFDLSPVTGLTNLTFLQLTSNAIEDLSPVAGLTNLTSLTLRGDSITDISALAGLTDLTSLALDSTNISDISPVAGLTNLTRLYFEGTNISDISAVAGLTNLTSLEFYLTNISDISPLAGLTNLTLLQLAYNNISDISALAGLTNLTYLTLGGNNIKDLSPLVANKGLGEGDRIYVNRNPLNAVSIDTHIPALRSRGVQVSAKNLITPQVVVVPDPNLRAAIESALGIAPGGTISVEQMATLTTLHAENSDISDLTGLEFATNLTWLNLKINTISDITAVEGLTNLTTLQFSVNAITDITAVVGLTNLATLELGSNAITDISAVTGLTNLNALGIGHNNITDISPVTGLANLTWLRFWNNAVEDLSPLVANKGLGEGDRIYVNRNPLNAVSIDTHIPALISRGVEVYFDNRTPRRIRIVSGNNQQGPPGAALAKPFAVEVHDQSDKPLSDIDVAFTVTSGGGTLSATSVTTDANGRAQSVLTLGPAPGANTVTMSVSGIQENQTFTAQGIRIPETLAISSGGDQEGPPGSALANPFEVEVRDQSDKPLAGVQVTFSVTAGGGTLSATSVMTDSDGRAESILTLGPDPGTNSVDVTVAGITRTETYTAQGIRTPLAFWIISGFDQKGFIGEALPRPIVVYVSDRSGEPLPGAEVTFTVTGGGGTLSVTSAMTDSDGRAESILTLGPDPGTNTVEVAVSGILERQTAKAIGELPPIPEDVNRDDAVNILDLVRVASVLGTEGADLAGDVNGDGIVNILDLVMVAGALGNAAAAPSADPRALMFLTATDVRQWLAQTRILDLTDAISPHGVLFLERLLAALTPKETALLPNYPNPFNPETWIPYHLANDAAAQLTIYDARGALVRRLALGHQGAGYYTDQSRATYWDGKNQRGDSVASGVYFYQLWTEHFSAVRKMVIVK